MKWACLMGQTAIILKMVGTGAFTLGSDISNFGTIFIESNRICGGFNDMQIPSSSLGFSGIGAAPGAIPSAMPA